jgi:predicted GNAT family acetyltransferase
LTETDTLDTLWLLEEHFIEHNTSIGCAVALIGMFTVFTHGTVPVPWYNYATPTNGDEIPASRDLIDIVTAHYRGHSLTPRFNFTRECVSRELPEVIESAGYARDEYEHILLQTEPVAVAPPDGLVLDEVPVEEDEAYAHILRVSFGARPSVERDWRPRLTAAMRAAGVHRLGGWVDGTLAGVATVHARAGVGFVTAVATLPEYRQRGIAAALTARASEVARDEGAQCVMLTVVDSPAAAPAGAERIYRRLGFRRAGLRLGYSVAGTE